MAWKAFRASKEATMSIQNHCYTTDTRSQLHKSIFIFSTLHPQCSLRRHIPDFFFFFKRMQDHSFHFIDAWRGNCYASSYNSSLIVSEFMHTLECYIQFSCKPKGIQTSMLFPWRITERIEVCNNLVSE